jgi:DNA-binding CsgD family transcriptional regulator
MCLSLIGIVIAFANGDSVSGLFLPLIFTDGLGGAYTEFFILGFPVFCLIGSKRPVIAAASGVITYLIASALSWTAILWLPEPLRALDTALFASTAVSIIALILLMKLFFEQLNEKSLALDLHRLLYYGEDSAHRNTFHADDLSVGSTSAEREAPDVSDTKNMENAGLSPDEIKIALLLIEGGAQRDTYRKLRMSAVEFDKRVKTIREKVTGISHSDAVIAAVATKYKLTKRETDMLKMLRHNKSNEDIAGELFLSQETIRTHIRNLMAKIPVENRNEISGWIDSL